jgi:hypothetical protein
MKRKGRNLYKRFYSIRHFISGIEQPVTESQRFPEKSGICSLEVMKTSGNHYFCAKQNNE